MLRRLTGADWDALTPLLRKVYPSNPRLVEKDFFDWLYRGASGEYHFWLFQKNGQITSFFAENPLPAMQDGQPALGAWPSLWWGTNTEQAVSVFLHTMEKYHPRIYVGMAPISVRFTRALGMAIQERMPRWVAVLDSECVASFCDGDEHISGLLRESADRLVTLPTDDAAIREITEFDDDFEAMPSTFYPPVSSFIRRQGTFLNWRYMRMPRHNYRAMLDSESGSLVIFRIEAVKDRTYSVLRMVEWIVRPDRVETMLGKVVAEARRAGVVLMDFFCSSRLVGAPLEPYGFVDESHLGYAVPAYFRPLWKPPRGNAVAVDFLPLKEKKNIDFEHWYIVRGDGDSDRVKL